MPLLNQLKKIGAMNPETVGKAAGITASSMYLFSSYVRRKQCPDYDPMVEKYAAKWSRGLSGALI